MQGKRKHYSLDGVISVGYRANSAQATQFRIWATRTLKQHLVEGYTLNQHRLQERGVEFEQVVGLLLHTPANQSMVNTEGTVLLAVIHDYARSWSLLQAYDDQPLTDVHAKQPAMHQ